MKNIKHQSETMKESESGREVGVSVVVTSTGLPPQWTQASLLQRVGMLTIIHWIQIQERQSGLSTGQASPLRTPVRFYASRPEEGGLTLSSGIMLFVPGFHQTISYNNSTRGENHLNHTGLSCTGTTSVINDSHSHICTDMYIKKSIFMKF